MGDSNVILKPLSRDILNELRETLEVGIAAEEVADKLKISPRAVNAAVTKALIRRGFVVRVHKVTRLMKKSYSVLQITPRGLAYLEETTPPLSASNSES